tara:strand:+ start:234 stop:635 length:402 start_codon:yes stop_codon:yes gene_type:complete
MSPSDDREIQHNPEEKIFRDVFDEDLIDDVAAESFFTRSRMIFSGRSKKIYWLLLLIYFAILAVLVWTAVSFFQADAIKDMVFWGISTLFGGVVIVAFELWFWMEMNRNSLLREVKRLELQVSLLREENKPDA